MVSVQTSHPSGDRTATSGCADHIVNLSNVVYRRDGQEIIQGISLQLTERRIGIVGRNGSGKSTLARLICGLIRPTSGTVQVNEIDVARDRKNAIGTVGIVFQNPDHQIIFPTVEEEIAFGLTQHGHSKQGARKAARELLNRFGVAGWADRPIHTLSQGQRHLVCLLSTLAVNPSLIVLDEPFTGPDIPTVMRLHRFLEKLEAALLLVTHDITALGGYDRVIWIDNGRVKGDGNAVDVLGEFHLEMQRLGNSDDFADFTD